MAFDDSTRDLSGAGSDPVNHPLFPYPNRFIPEPQTWLDSKSKVELSCGFPWSHVWRFQKAWSKPFSESESWGSPKPLGTPKMASVVLLVPFKTNSAEPFGGQQDSCPPTAVEMAHFVLVGYVGSRVWGGGREKKDKTWLVP